MSSIKRIIVEASEVSISRIHSTDCVGTSKKNQFQLPYRDLVAKLGPPEIHPSGSDIKVSWCGTASTDDDEFVFSVYGNPLYLDHIKPEYMDDWCVGTKDPYQAMLIRLHLIG